ncbi:polysaccharide pyruvyl transferase family protein [Jannaschia sp. R86511]|uniref:polysaccharide pyruvyl transferase family protein n=1 Tax=Jannaschia sp. R86511 TaxID=3093853 RepID=UPI0036D24C3D
MTDGQGPRLSLFGAPGSNTNLGLNALMQGTVAAALQAEPGARFTVFDNELGVRDGRMTLDGRTVGYRLVGARRSRRVTRPESYAAMTAALLVRGRGNPGTRAVMGSDLVLDVSGGDSFSDIYGMHRFRTVCAPKRFALRAGRPLVLLPQTYGPFASRQAEDEARSLVRDAEQAWARDADSHAVLLDLLGQDADPERHRLGVDLAMMLPASPSTGLPGALSELMDRRPVGVNVSGLLWNSPEPFGLRADYRETVRRVVTELVGQEHEVVLVPHVLGRRPGGEADNLAADALHSLLPDAVGRRVVPLAWLEDAGQAKAVVSRCSFFVGTRMHSTIAALSTGTACCAIAYSSKYQGVFAGLGVAEASLDARVLSTDELVASVLATKERAEQLRATLARTVPEVQAQAVRQMVQILDARRPVSSARR